MSHSQLFNVGSFYNVEPFEFWVGEEIASIAGQARHLLKNRLVLGEVTAMYGEPKSGKTHVAVNLALQCAQGMNFWGEPFPEHGPVVIFAAERKEEFAQRLVAAARLQGLENVPQNIILADGHSRCGVTNMDRLTQLEQFVGLHDPNLVIFDNYSRLIDNDEDKARDATDNVEAFELIVKASRRPCAGVLIHHTGKDASRGMRGSSAGLAAVTTAWRVTKDEEGVICLAIAEANAFSPCSPQYFEIQTVEIIDDDYPHEIHHVGVAVETEAPTPGGRREKVVLSFWIDNPHSLKDADEVARLLRAKGEESSSSTVGRTLKELVNKGELVTEKSGNRFLYQITDIGLGRLMPRM